MSRVCLVSPVFVDGLDLVVQPVQVNAHSAPMVSPDDLVPKASLVALDAPEPPDKTDPPEQRVSQAFKVLMDQWDRLEERYDSTLKSGSLSL